MLLKDFVPVDWSRIKGVVSQNKDDCIKWIKKYIDLGIKFRSFGVEAFEKECSISKNQFEKIALEMSINGDCPEYAFTVMGNFIQARWIPWNIFRTSLLFSLLFWNMRKAFP